MLVALVISTVAKDVRGSPTIFSRPPIFLSTLRLDCWMFSGRGDAEETKESYGPLESAMKICSSPLISHRSVDWRGKRDLARVKTHEGPLETGHGSIRYGFICFGRGRGDDRSSAASQPPPPLPPPPSLSPLFLLVSWWLRLRSTYTNLIDTRPRSSRFDCTSFLCSLRRRRRGRRRWLPRHPSSRLVEAFLFLFFFFVSRARSNRLIEPRQNSAWFHPVDLLLHPPKERRVIIGCDRQARIMPLKFSGSFLSLSLFPTPFIDLPRRFVYRDRFSPVFFATPFISLAGNTRTSGSLGALICLRPG